MSTLAERLRAALAATLLGLAVATVQAQTGALGSGALGSSLAFCRGALGSSLAFCLNALLDTQTARLDPDGAVTLTALRKRQDLILTALTAA